MSARTALELGCDLCGLACGTDPYLTRIASADRHFCCLGCMNVYSILHESGALAPGVNPRDTALFQRSLALGIISTTGRRPRTAPPSIEGAPVEEKLFHISGLWCSACAWLIERTLTQQPGVVSAEVYFVSDLLKIRYQPQSFPSVRVPELLERLGYRAAEYDGENGHAEAERKDLLLRLGIAAFFWVNVMGLNLSVYLGAFDRMPGNFHRLLPFVVLALAAPVLLYSARPILRLAWRGLFSLTLRMETLLALGILAAFGYSAVECFRGGTHIYFDIACAIVTLVLIGKSIEQGAKHRAARTISSLHRMLPKKVRLLAGGQERFVAMEALRPGDLFTVKAGERIPADGVVTEGESQADESLLTGEAAPVSKSGNAAVVAGSLNLSSPLTIRATTVGKDSTIAHIVAAVERAISSRSDLERKADRVSRIFVPAVIAFSALTAAGWLAAGLEPHEALLRAVTILVIACPCALGIATPLALTAAVGAASRSGVLVRDSRVLESARAIDTVILDKTGTVTEDQYSLLHARPEHFPLVASLEAYSEHPLGKAAFRRALDLHLELEPASDVQVHRGLGIRGNVAGVAISAGSRRFFENIPPDLEMQAEIEEECGRTVSFYSIDSVVKGILTFGGRIRPEAQALVDGLHQRGIRVLLVSGDSQATTQAVARQLGVDDFYAATLPEEKAHIVEQWKARGSSVAVIGDGINDAPALAQANLGIAMGAGADLAMRAASMVLLSGNLLRILDAFDLSRRTVAVVRQNLFWAFFYNVAGIGFAAAGLLNPIIAAVAMVTSSISVIANSYRLSRVRASEGR